MAFKVLHVLSPPCLPTIISSFFSTISLYPIYQTPYSFPNTMLVHASLSIYLSIYILYPSLSLYLHLPNKLLCIILNSALVKLSPVFSNNSLYYLLYINYVLCTLNIIFCVFISLLLDQELLESRD